MAVVVAKIAFNVPFFVFYLVKNVFRYYFMLIFIFE